MSTETVKRCDVTGKIREDVVKVVANISEYGDDGITITNIIWEKDMDLCDEAIARLKKFIIRGTTPLGGKGKG